MQPRTLVIAVFLAAGCATAPARATPPPPPQAEVTLEVFVDALAPHGEWIVVGSHGRVWRPLHVAAGWQPYLHGEWVWTDEGWFWLTDEPWGWATYHYGRWAYDRAFGWVWVPGIVWAPAWVAWRVGDGFVGWAPLYPAVEVWWVDTYPLEPPHWIFVPTTRFVGARVDVAAYPRARVPALLRTSRPAPPRSVVRAPAPRLGGPEPRLVEKQVGRPLKPARIVEVPAPADARRGGEPGSVPVYRPHAPRPARAASPAPAPTPVPATAPRSGAAAPERPDATRERARAEAPAPKPRPAPAPGRTPVPGRTTAEEEARRPAPVRP